MEEAVTPEDGAGVLQLRPLDQRPRIISWEQILNAENLRRVWEGGGERGRHLCLSSPPGDSDASSSLKISDWEEAPSQRGREWGFLEGQEVKGWSLGRLGTGPASQSLEGKG